MVVASAMASLGAVIVVLISLMGGTKEEEPPESFGAALGEFGLSQLEDIEEGARSVYALACLNETGVDITNATDEQIDDVVAQLYAIADTKNFDDGDMLSDDWYCCMGGMINEMNMRGDSLDGIWAYFDALGMGFWEEVANAMTTMGAATECTIQPLFDEAVRKVADAIARGLDAFGEFTGWW